MALFCALSSISRHPGDSTGMYALSSGRLLFHPGKRLSGGVHGSTLQARLLLGLSVRLALDYHCPSSTDKISRPFFTFKGKYGIHFGVATKVLKHGMTKVNVTLRCKRCRCVFTAEPEDIEWAESFGEPYVNCPECKRAVKTDEDFYAE